MISSLKTAFHTSFSIHLRVSCYNKPSGTVVTLNCVYFYTSISFCTILVIKVCTILILVQFSCLIKKWHFDLKIVNKDTDNFSVSPWAEANLIRILLQNMWITLHICRNCAWNNRNWHTRLFLVLYATVLEDTILYLIIGVILDMI